MGGRIRRRCLEERRRLSQLTATGLTVMFAISGAMPAAAHGDGTVEVGNAVVGGTTVTAWSESDEHGAPNQLVVEVHPTPDAVRVDLEAGEVIDLTRHVDTTDGSTVTWRGPMPAGTGAIELLIGDGIAQAVRLERTAGSPWLRPVILILGAQCLLVAGWHLTRARRAFRRPSVHVSTQTREATT